MGDEELEGDGVSFEGGDDDVGVAFAGLDEGVVHRFYCGKVLVVDTLEVSSALFDVAFYASEEADIRVSIKENFDVKKVVDFRDSKK